MSYFAYITRIKNIRPHPNADRLNLGDCFGNTVIIDKSYNETDLYIYFPTDGQLSVEYATVNNLFRKKDDAGNNIGGYMDPDKRNVKAIKLRGEKSDGLVMPLSSLETFGKINEFTEGMRFTTFNGHEICCKYIPVRRNKTGNVSAGNRTRKKTVPLAPLFVEHADTEQLAYNLGAFKPGDEIEITLKMHGTSQRTGYLPILKGYKKTFWEKLFRKEGTPIYDWGYVSGTRRVVLNDYDGGYYGSNEFREQHSKAFEGKLWKGEEIFYEVVGFTHIGTPIMATADNKKINDKDFVKQYGKTTTFSYGCDPNGSHEHLPVSDIYVYRMTMTNEDGDVVEYTPDFMRYRCEQMGVKTVPVMWKGVIPDFEQLGDDVGSLQRVDNTGEWIKNIAEGYYDGPDPIGKTHIREGVVVRILNRPKFCAYKHKNFAFKVLEGIIKETAEAPDMEEAQEVEDNV